MSGMRAIREVARRELVERSRSRAVRLSFAVVLVLVIAGAVAAARIGKGTPSDDFGLVGPRAQAAAPALQLQARAEGRRARLHPLANTAAAERAVSSGQVDVAIVPGRLIVKTSTSGAALRVAQGALAAQSTIARLRALGLTQSQAVRVYVPRPVAVHALDPEKRGTARNRDLVFAGLFVLYMALIGFGTTVASSVTEEKSSRVVELLLTTVSPRRLMAGKVLGVGLLGLAQLVVVGAAGLLAGRLAGGAGLPSGAPGTVALVLLWFVLGFAFYSVAYAAVGALVSRQEDLNAAVAPITLVMVGSYFGAMAAVADPNGTWAQVAALLPPFAPMVVPARMVLGDMGALGLLLSVALELIGTFALVVVAARIYERAILRIGAPVSLRGLLREASGREPRQARRPAGVLR